MIVGGFSSEVALQALAGSVAPPAPPWIFGTDFLKLQKVTLEGKKGGLEIPTNTLLGNCLAALINSASDVREGVERVAQAPGGPPTAIHGRGTIDDVAKEAHQRPLRQDRQRVR
jgi:hypothetical protein